MYVQFMAWFVAGLLFGSFINALVWRMRNKRNWVRERSECTNCGHVLHAKDLIPVVSWLWLKGRCRYCGKNIDDTPLTELITGLAFGLSYVMWPTNLIGIERFSFVCWLLLLVVLIALALYDLRYMLLPNKLVSVAAIPVLIHVIVRAAAGNPSFLLQSVIGLLSFGGLFYLLFQISQGKWIGGGDVKLGFVLGAWLASPILSLLAIFVAAFVGLIVVAIVGLRSKLTLQSKIPFGPMLIFGTFVATLCGSWLIESYMSLVIPY